MAIRVYQKKASIKGTRRTVHYRYSNKASICGTKTPYWNSHLLSVVTCKRCKKVIRGMLRG